MNREELGKFIHEAYWDIVRKDKPDIKWPTWEKCNKKEDWYRVADKVMALFDTEWKIEQLNNLIKKRMQGEGNENRLITLSVGLPNRVQSPKRRRSKSR